MNTPYKRELHLEALKRAVPGIKISPPNAFGDSPNNANWAAFDVPGGKAKVFKEACAVLGLYTGWFGEANYAHSGDSVYVVAKYVRDE